MYRVLYIGKAHPRLLANWGQPCLNLLLLRGSMANRHGDIVGPCCQKVPFHLYNKVTLQMKFRILYNFFAMTAWAVLHG